MVFWEAVKLAYVLRHVERILTQYTQIYFKTFLGMRMSSVSIYGTEQQACQCCLPRIPSCRIVHGLYFASDNDTDHY